MRKILLLVFFFCGALVYIPEARAQIGEIDVNAGPPPDKPVASNRSAVWIESKTRAILLLTDDRGRRAGVDLKSRKTFQDIPDSQCETDFLTNQYTGEEQVGVYEHITLQPARAGRYHITLRGLQDGPFEVNISALSREGSSLPSKQLEGLISEGELKTFQLSYDPEPHSQMTVIENQNPHAR